MIRGSSDRQGRRESSLNEGELSEESTVESGRSRAEAPVVHGMEELIGSTPLLRLRIDDGEGAKIYVKLENLNPSGSIRDRYLAEILKRAVDAGQLVEGDTVSVAGIDDCSVSAALLARRIGVDLKVFASRSSSRRLLTLVERYGAEIEWLDEEVDWGGAVDRAAEWARRSHDRMFVNGYRHEAVRDSYAVIADEILESLGDAPVGAFITSVTTGGAYRQVAGELRESHPQMVVGGAVLGSQAFPSLVEERQDFLRDVSIEETWEVRDRIAQRYGLLLGPKGAAAVSLGLELRERIGPGKSIVALNPDAGQRYLGWEEKTLTDFDRT